MEGARNNTVCFMLSNEEKRAVDRLAFCMHITRSGILAKVVVEFVTAAESSKQGHEAEKTLLTHLEECRKAAKKRGHLAAKFLAAAEGRGNTQ
jgi:hypothetical protein